MGNISFARIIAKFKHGDITKKGSGNPGSMNVLRNYGFKLGFLTLVCDAIKGAIPALVGELLFGFGTEQGMIGLYVAGLCVILGHNYPVFYKFKGGKGIACALGVFLVADPLWLLLFFVIAFVYLWFFDYGSLASLSIVSALTIIQGIKNYDNPAVCMLLFTIYVLTIFAHRQNIRRLLVGKENKANLQKSIKKQFNKKNSEIKTEYKAEKNEVKAEFKQEKEKLKDNKKLYREQKKKYNLEKKRVRDYYQKKRKTYSYASVLEAVETQDKSAKLDNE